MNESILTWNFTNWVTVVLMATGGFLIFAMVAQFGRKAIGQGKTA